MTNPRTLPPAPGNIALAAVKTHREHLNRTALAPSAAAAARQAIRGGNTGTQPLPPARQVHVCVVCHTENPTSTTRATWVTSIGHALCDDHKAEHDETGHLPVMTLLHP